MRSIGLKIGKRVIPFEYDQERFEILGGAAPKRELSDHELGKILDSPIESPKLEDLIEPNQTVLIAVPDATREVGAGQVVNLLVRRLIANGTMPYEIAVIFSTGLHRPVTPSEQQSILTPFIAQRVKTLTHDPRDLMATVLVGKTATGIPVEINRNIVEADHVILVGGISYHYFAGYTGGRKLICPGLASKRTIVGSHSLAFDTVTHTRAGGVGPGLLDGNPVHDALTEAVAFIDPSFAINTHCDEHGEILAVTSGDWNQSHRTACDEYANQTKVSIESKRDLVIVSCGGFPHDINLIQAHKAIDMAAACCREGGTIILLAECREGAGSEEFLKWIEFRTSAAIGSRLAEKYSIGGQTAWSLMSKTEKFDIRIVTRLSEDATRKAGLRKEQGLAAALAGAAPSSSGFILPYGPKFLPVTK